MDKSGDGMGFLFIPLTTLTLSSIPRPQMGNATSIWILFSRSCFPGPV